jgi:hypothetical protein
MTPQPSLIPFFIPPQFPEHGFYELRDKILLFRHDQGDANVLRLITAPSDVTEGTLVEVVLSGTSLRHPEIIYCQFLR